MPAEVWRAAEVIERAYDRLSALLDDGRVLSPADRWLLAALEEAAEDLLWAEKAAERRKEAVPDASG